MFTNWTLSKKEEKNIERSIYDIRHGCIKVEKGILVPLLIISGYYSILILENNLGLLVSTTSDQLLLNFENNYSGDSTNRHSHKRQLFLQPPSLNPVFLILYIQKLWIFTLSSAASSTYGHLFCIPMMLAYKGFFCNFD